MNFKEAHKKLQIIADGRYNSMQYELITMRNGKLIQQCGVYCDGLDWAYKPTWQEALDKLEGKVVVAVSSVPDIPEL